MSKGGAGRSRPHTWIVGTDTYKHDMYHPWQAHRAQAKYRGEEYTLAFEDFYELWLGYWHDRGRAGDDLILTRIDPEKAWDRLNCQLRIRKEYLAEINKKKVNLGRRKNQSTDIEKKKILK